MPILRSDLSCRAGRHGHLMLPCLFFAAEEGCGGICCWLGFAPSLSFGMYHYKQQLIQAQHKLAGAAEVGWKAATLCCTAPWRG